MSDLSFRAARALLLRLEPERAHGLALSVLQAGTLVGLVPRVTSDPAEGVELLGLRFPNRIGLAAGFDKNGRYIDALGRLGFGHIEVGTVTPQPQPGQDKPRVFRLPQAGALLNRMGFPNEGAAAVAARISRRSFTGICGVNIGKNAATPLDEAVRDYATAFEQLAPHADYVAINVSSPNTAQLRELLDVERLQPILAALLECRERCQRDCGRRVPLLVKISPDQTEAQLSALLRMLGTLAIDGVIAANTTVSRTSAAGPHIAAARPGGLSGAPLRPLAETAVRIARRELGAAAVIIGVGGIASGGDARAMLAAGADLVQVYTGLVYRGPSLIRALRAAVADWR